MSDWNPNAPADPSNVPPPLNPAGGPATEVCSECGRVFPGDELIHHGNVAVCAQCKPVFMQKLAEGAQIEPGQLHYAGFWIRFLAIIVDGVLLMVVNGLIGVLFGTGIFATMLGTQSTTIGAMQIIGMLLGFVIGIVYETLLIGKYGATLGKMACKLRVVTPEGERITYLRSFGRYFAKLLSYLTLYIGFIIAGFDQEKRALHDHVCATRVIYV